MRSGRSLHASNSDCNFVQSGIYSRPFRKLDREWPAIGKSERRRVVVEVHIVLLLKGCEPSAPQCVSASLPLHLCQVR